MARRKQPMNKTIKAAYIIAAAILGSVVLDNIIWKALEDNTTCASSYQLQLYPVQLQYDQLESLMVEQQLQINQNLSLGLLLS